MFTLPPELIDIICYAIDSSSDLLAFALTSKQMKAIIIPDHLHFRHIRFDHRRSGVWKILAENEAIAAHCFRLDILEKESDYELQKPRLPPALDLPADRTLLATAIFNRHSIPHSLIVNAIRGMHRLTAFRWWVTEPPSSEVWNTVLGSCRKIDEVDFHAISYGRSRPLYFVPIPSVLHITKFALVEFTFAPLNHDHVEAQRKALRDLLLACPHLEDLYLFRSLGDDVANMKDLFEVASWPHLRRLSTFDSSLDDCHDHFFQAHPSLERLAIRHASSRVTFSNLPNLKSLEIDWIPLLHQISDDVLAGCTHLGLSLKEPGPDYIHKLQWLLSRATNLRILELSDMVYEQEILLSIVEYIPQIEKLRLHAPLLGTFMSLRDMDPLLRSLGCLPKLTHFSLLESCWKSTIEPTTGEVARTHDVGTLGGQNRSDPDLRDSSPTILALSLLCTYSSSLDNVELASYDDYGNRNIVTTWVLIQRNHDGSYAGHSETKRPFNWSGCYYGAQVFR